MSIDYDQIKIAYRKLKSFVYYDKTDLKLRSRLAQLDCDNNLEERLKTVQNVVNSSEPSNHSDFRSWLKDIDFRVVPKKIQWDKDDNHEEEINRGKFISNVTSTKSINVEKVNYFFDGPIELHLISVIWIMFEGRFLDKQLGAECSGSRLATSLHEGSDSSQDLFKKYHEQYSRWRDNGIQKAKQLLTEDKLNVAILGLDIQEYFYRIRLDFKSVKFAVRKEQLKDIDYDQKINGHKLTCCIEKICYKYREIVTPYLKATHPGLNEKDIGLPIGICSSLVLANWYLKKFDDLVLKDVRPSYYGRYVDDILIVLPASRDPEKLSDKPVAFFIEDILVKNKILSKPVDQRYEISSLKGLFLQQGKCILQYFDRNHSLAGLDKFQKNLERNGSDFALLPVDEADNSLEDVAYELMYEGSVNKFRSVKGMSENRFELAKHLARQTMLHLYTDDKPDPAISSGLRKFFKGKNSIEFYDLWERVFTVFLISDNLKSGSVFKKHLLREMKKVDYSGSKTITEHLFRDLKQHLELSIAMAEALTEENINLSELFQNIYSELFRDSNLIRNHFIRKPLINFTNFTGPLTERDLENLVQIDERKLQLSPRYINFDECMLFAMSGDVDLKGKSPFDFADQIYQIANGQELDGIEWKADQHGDINNNV